MKRNLIERFKIKKGWKAFRPQIVNIEKGIYYIEYVLSKPIPDDEKEKVIRKIFTDIYSELDEIDNIPSDYKQDIKLFTDDIIEHTLSTKDYEDFNTMCEAYKILGRSPMKDIFSIYDMLHSLVVMYDKSLSDFEKELINAGINLEVAYEGL